MKVHYLIERHRQKIMAFYKMLCAMEGMKKDQVLSKFNRERGRDMHSEVCLGREAVL